MRIGVVGGMDRLAPKLKSLATAAGHELEVHPGQMSGPASDRLRSLVDRVDLVVIVTDLNSHAAVLRTRDIARRAHRPVRLVRRLGTSQLHTLWS